MLVCHCNVITRSEIEDTIRSLLDEDPWQLIVPLKVYHAIGKRGRCCGCFPNVAEIIFTVTEAYHRALQTPEEDVIDLIERIRSEHDRLETVRKSARLRLSGRVAA